MWAFILPLRYHDNAVMFIGGSSETIVNLPQEAERHGVSNDS
jgi:hypothetical protein